MILGLLRAISGTVAFRCEGAACEQFLNLATRANLGIFKVNKKGITLTARIPVKNYKKLRPIAKRSMCKVRIEKKQGFPFFLHKHRFRYGILAGLFTVAVVSFYLSGCVLNVVVEGNNLVTTEDILKALDTRGIHLLARKNEIPFHQIEQDLSSELPHLSWVGLSVNGTTVTVSVRERVLAPERVPLTEPCNIIADEGGVVKKITPRNGTAQVAVGDGVLKGQQLISGVLGDKVGNVTLVHAMGDVVLEVQRTISISMEYKEVQRQYQPEYANTALYIGSFCVPLGGGGVPENAEVYTVKEPFYLLGFRTPIEMETVHVEPYVEVTVERNEDELKEYLVKELERREQLELYDVKQLSKNYHFERTENGLTIIAEYTCEKNVSSQQTVSIGQ